MSIDPAAIRETAAAISSYLRTTPIVALDTPALPGVSLKLELLQHAGSFKTRGAFANLLRHTVPTAGVVAASGGNHGAAVAYAAQRLGIPATIFVPRISSAAKVERIRGYGAKLVITGDAYADALEASRTWSADRDVLTVHAFDQIETILGQGTLALEVEDQMPDVDTVLAAVGGGGLIAGIAAWFGRRVRVIGVEPETAPTLTRALEAGRPVDAPAGGVAAEPGGATAFAAVASGAYKPRKGERVVIVVSGGNTTAVDFERTHAR